MVRKLLFLGLAVAFATTAFANSTIDSGEAPIPQDPFDSDPLVPSNILLIQDQLGWGYNSHIQILNASGIPYTVINSGQIAAHDFSQYDKIITVGQQPDNYYYAIQTNTAKFEDYMASGGCVSFEIANYFGGANEYITWPGGFTAPIVDCINTINIVDPSSCLMENVTNAELQNWNCSAHGIVGNTPAGYVNVLSHYAGTCAGWFPFGNGGAYVSNQPLEWGYAGYSQTYPRNFDLCECGTGPTATESTTWGQVKGLYR